MPGASRSSASMPGANGGALGGPPSRPPLRLVRDQIDRAGTPRRITAEISGAPDLETLFEDVLDSSISLFNCELAGLWLYDGSDRPFKLVGHRGMPDELTTWIANLGREANAASVQAIRRGQV